MDTFLTGEELSKVLSKCFEALKSGGKPCFDHRVDTSRTAQEHAGEICRVKGSWSEIVPGQNRRIRQKSAENSA